MLVHRRVTPSIKFAGTHLYTWVERGTVTVKCLAKEHNTMSLARARTWSARSGVERANHEATAPPTAIYYIARIFCRNHLNSHSGFRWCWGRLFNPTVMVSTLQRLQNQLTLKKFTVVAGYGAKLHSLKDLFGPPFLNCRHPPLTKVLV